MNTISDFRELLDGQPSGASRLDVGDHAERCAEPCADRRNSVAFSRTPRQMPNIVCGGVNATKWLFFPDGLNGQIRQFGVR